MTRKVTRSQKARGKQATVNGHSVVIRVPRGELSVPEVEANLQCLVANKHPNMLWDFTKFPRYVQHRRLLPMWDTQVLALLLLLGMMLLKFPR